MTPEAAEYSIAAVSKLTGVSCHALRVWERRYGFPLPHRSASGHRRYSREQVQALRTITQTLQSGRPISELIAELITGRVASHDPPNLLAEQAEEAPEAGGGGVERLVDSLTSDEPRSSEALYLRLTEGLDPVETVVRVIGPAWIDAGERWFRRERAIYHERIISDFLRRKLEVMIEAARSANEHPSRSIVVGTVQGDRHVGGVLMLSLLLERAGWRVINLGVDLPIREYAAAVKQWNPDTLALSFVLSRNIKKRFQELSQIRDLPIFVGGRSILNYQGLARRHGLIPLPGPIAPAVIQLSSACEQWVEAHKVRE